MNWHAITADSQDERITGISVSARFDAQRFRQRLHPGITALADSSCDPAAAPTDNNEARILEHYRSKARELSSRHLG